MPRQANGSYQPPAATSAVSGATISSTSYNSLSTDIGTELTNSLDRLGRGAMEANLDLGGFTAVNAADPTTAQQLATKAYADGLITGLSATYAPVTRTITAGTGLSGGGTLAADRTLTLANTAVTPGAYTAANITVDAQGRVTAAASGTTLPTQTSNGGKVLKTDGSSASWSGLTVTANASVAAGGAVTFANNMSISGTTTSFWTVTLSGLANANYSISISQAFTGGSASIAGIASKTSTGFTVNWVTYNAGGAAVPGTIVDITIVGGL